MSRLRQLLRPRLTVDFCDGCACVEVCDAGCYAERARATVTSRALDLGLRL